jgi:hypothetical protein
MKQALKPGCPLAFTYHHNAIDAYFPVAVAVLDAGLTCSASLPCPGEMGASIHISGTGSSIIDTVFVCRSTGTVFRRLISDAPSAVANMVRDDLISLGRAGIKPTAGDIKCVAYGHIIRLAVWFLRTSWQVDAPVSERLGAVGGWVVQEMGGVSAVLEALGEEFAAAPRLQPLCVQEGSEEYGSHDESIAF